MEQIELEEIKNEIKQIGLQKVLHDAKSSELVSKYYLQLFHESLCSTCPGKLAEAYSQILNLNIQNFLTMANSKYKVANDGVIDTVYSPIAGVPYHVSNANITDEIAEKLIKANPNFKKQLVTSSEAGDKPAESKQPAAPSAIEARIEEIDSTMTGPDIQKALTKLKVAFSPGASKSDLAKLLAESEGK